jgi:hypothetical protein
MAKVIVLEVSASTIRKLFNDGKYAERLSAGEFTTTCIREGTPSPAANQPAGTKSQIVEYLDANGNRVALVHQYLLPDGTLGAGGKPDPKKLWQNGAVYSVRPD